MKQKMLKSCYEKQVNEIFKFVWQGLHFEEF